MTNEKNDEKKSLTIIVNGTPHDVPKGDITFTQVLALATGLPTGENILYTITYRKAEGNKPEGILVEGGMAKVKEGTIFNVTATDRS